VKVTNVRRAEEYGLVALSLDLEFLLSWTRGDVGDDEHKDGVRSAGTRKLARICGFDGNPGDKRPAAGCRTRDGEAGDGTGGDDTASTSGGMLGDSLELVRQGTVWGIQGALQLVSVLIIHRMHAIT
jgi:hypothetical protein